MYSVKYLPILALLGVVQVAGKNQKPSTMAQVHTLNRQFQEFDGSLMLKPAQQIGQQQMHHSQQEQLHAEMEEMPTFAWSDSMQSNLQHGVENEAAISGHHGMVSTSDLGESMNVSGMGDATSGTAEGVHQMDYGMNGGASFIENYGGEVVAQQAHTMDGAMNYGGSDMPISSYSASSQQQHDALDNSMHSMEPYSFGESKQADQVIYSGTISQGVHPELNMNQPGEQYKQLQSYQQHLQQAASAQQDLNMDKPLQVEEDHSAFLGKFNNAFANKFQHLMDDAGASTKEASVPAGVVDYGGSMKESAGDLSNIYIEKEASPEIKYIEAEPIDLGHVDVSDMNDFKVPGIVAAPQEPQIILDYVPDFNIVGGETKEVNTLELGGATSVGGSVVEKADGGLCKVKLPAQEGAPEYTQIYNAFYEQPEVDLYFLDKPTGQYFKTETLAPQLDYYFWDTPTQSFEVYEPTPVAWDDYYQPPTEALFYYDNGLEDYIVVKEPSPYIEYLTYDEATEDFVDYVPVSLEWTQVYEPPAVDLYSYAPQTKTYFIEAEPSPFKQYYFYNEATEQYQKYEPSVPKWTEYYEMPVVDLATYDSGLKTVVPEMREPSPLEQYFAWDEKTQHYIEFEPTPVQWTQYYEVPAVQLYKQESTTQAFKEVVNPSPYIQYHYYDEATQTFQEYEPSPVVWNEYFQVPQVQLYSYEPSTQRFVPESKPSPYVQYYNFEPTLKDYVQYEPTPVVWTDYYEPPKVDLYWQEPSTRTFVLEDAQPSPYVQYFQIGEPSKCITPANPEPSAQKPSFIEYEPTPVQWTKYYEEPIVDLYYYEPDTKTFEIEENPSPYIQYVYKSEATQQFELYQPTEIKWTDWYEPSVVPLFTYEPSTKTFEVEPNPSPYIQTYFFNVATQTYEEYEPVPAVWEEVYEKPEVDLYWYDQPSQTLIYESEPSPFVDYIYYEPTIESYAVYEPTPVQWTDHFEAPQSPLYYFDTATKTYNLESIPSPAVDYYTWNEKTQNFDEFIPTEVKWTNYFELPTTDLYIVSPTTQKLEIVKELSPYNQYYYISEKTGQATEYVPQPAIWTDYYEAPVVDLYIQNPSTNEYVVEPSPSPYQELFFVDQTTNTFAKYEPTPIVWEETFETPQNTLYYFDASTQRFIEETSPPSPKVQYFEYSEPTKQYIEYIPTPVHWDQYYEQPSVALYYFDNSTEQFVPEVEEPSPLVQYFSFDSTTKSFEQFVPTQAEWSDKFYQPEVDIYYFEPSMNQFIEEKEPSPEVQYYEWSEKTSSFIEYTPVPIQWTDFYEAPATNLYTLDTTTRQYVVVSEPSPLKEYSFWSEKTNTYQPYEPVIPAWTDKFEPPVVDLYYYEPTIESYVVVDEPSPLTDYVFYNENTQDYEEFVPTPVQWIEYYETPETQIFYFDVPTQTFQAETEEPSPYAQYYSFDETEQEFTLYQPTEVKWDNYFQAPETDIFFYEPSTQTYIKETTSPSPKVDYYTKSEKTGQYIPFEPLPLEWTDYNVEPEVQLFTYDEKTQSYVPESQPSPFVDYVYWKEETREFVPYEPTPISEQPAVYIEEVSSIKPSVPQEEPHIPTLQEYCLTRVGDAPVNAPTIQQQAMDNYKQIFTAIYEEPVRDVYIYDEKTSDFVVLKEPSPDQDLYFYNEPLESFTEFVPQPVQWSDYYQQPKEELLWHDEKTGVYIEIAEPSPYIEYVIQDEKTNQYVPYEPLPLVWTDNYEQPVVDLYWIDEATGTYNLESECTLSPAVQYHYWSEATSDFVPYKPVEADWTDYYEEPEVKLYYIEESINSYVHDKEPSPYVDYVFYNEKTKTYEQYEPVPVVWEDYYETPTVDLFYFDEPSQTYNLESQPSPYGEYFYYEPEVQQFVYFEPTVSSEQVVCID